MKAGIKSLESVNKEKRLITKTGLITGGLVSEASKKITETGLINEISHVSEAGRNPFIRPDLLINHAKK